MISNLHHRVLRVILHLEHLPLQQETVVYTRNRGVPKIAVPPSCFLLSDLVGQTRDYINFMLHFLHQSVSLLTGLCSDALVLSETFK